MGQASEDRVLLAAVGRGDARAFRRLFALLSPRVLRFLTRIVGNPAIAEELVSEVFLAVWQGAGRYEGKSEPATWVLSIAHNKAVSALRRRSEVGATDEAVAALLDEDDAPDVVMQKADKGQIMRQCIDRLSPDHKAILDLVYYQEQSVSEAALILAIPESTVKTRMFYARRKLAELLKARGIERGWP